MAIYLFYLCDPGVLLYIPSHHARFHPHFRLCECSQRPNKLMACFIVFYRDNFHFYLCGTRIICKTHMENCPNLTESPGGHPNEKYLE